jgi:phosphoribosylanthranilate isomerase
MKTNFKPNSVVMHVRIKICGLTNVADAELAATLGADMIGLNFYAKSPRCIDDAMAKSILNAIPDTVEPVALFVNEPTTTVQQIVQRLGIRTVQTYGDHREAKPFGTRWIPAFSVANTDHLQQLATFLELLRAAGVVPYAILIDANVPGQFGGTGQTAPWHLLADFDPGVPLILAGGLTPENVAVAIRIVRPFAVDVASGVESSPGKKDANKTRRFIEIVRELQ